MGEKVVVVQNGVQKQLKGWGRPVVVGGSRKKRRRQGAGSELLLEAWWRIQTAGVGGWRNLHPERVWTTGHLSCFCLRSRKLTHETGSSPSF